MSYNWIDMLIATKSMELMRLAIETGVRQNIVDMDGVITNNLRQAKLGRVD